MNNAAQQTARFDLRGINHLALTCSDMARTIHFYRDVLGMPLVKTIDFPGGRGKHYFFDCGNGDCVAFFEFPGGPNVVDQKTHGKMAATPGMMHHVAFGVTNEQIDAYRERLAAAGIEVTEVVNHDDTPTGASADVNESTFVRSIYFRDPDGMQLEFAAWSRPLTAQDVREDLRA
jgi:catechol 2,3-dioxygenase-like lactoylglutathione lyase family enzyme